MLAAVARLPTWAMRATASTGAASARTATLPLPVSNAGRGDESSVAAQKSAASVTAGTSQSQSTEA